MNFHAAPFLFFREDFRHPCLYISLYHLPADLSFCKQPVKFRDRNLFPVRGNHLRRQIPADRQDSHVKKAVPDLLLCLFYLFIGKSYNLRTLVVFDKPNM